ncbi:MAG: NB-ARC domain-containing protein [Chloroflexota bacterium]
MSYRSSNYYPEFAKLLEQYLARQDRSQAWLAEQLGVHHGSVSRWVAGNRPGKPEMVLRIADHLGIRHDDRQAFFVASGYAITSTQKNGGSVGDSSAQQGIHRSPSEEMQPLAASEHRWQTLINERLGPQNYARLFGIDAHIARLTKLLLERDDVWLVGIYGMGGLGKTTLADQVIRQPAMAYNFAQVAWVDIKYHEFIPEEGIVRIDHAVSDIEGIVKALCNQLKVAGHEPLPPAQKRKALLTYLKETPCLIILDNLEDIAETRTLVSFLQGLLNPSKVIITSRHALPNAPAIAQLAISHLIEEDAVAFLRHLIEMVGLPVADESVQKQLAQVYEIVGGNPLALRLVASQIRLLSLPTVLQGLAEIPDDEIDEFYGYIYCESWSLLMPEAQRLLRLLPLTDKAGSEQLQTISTLSQPKLNSALRQLARMSLIEVSGNIEDRRYFIYRLTETFLTKNAIEWKTDDTDGGKFQQGIARNLDYWRGWLAENDEDVPKLDLEWVGIVKAVRFGLMQQDALPKCYELIEKFSPYMEQRGHWEKWNRILQMAIKTAKNNVDTSSLPPVAISHARLLARQSRHREAVSAYAHAAKLAHEANDDFSKARAWTNLGYLFIELDHLWRAEVLCTHALRVFERIQNSHGLAHTHNHLGILYTRRWNWGTAIEHLNKALSNWHEMQDDHGLLFGYQNLGKLAVDMQIEGLEPPEPAIEYVKQAICFGEQTADEVAVALARMNMGTIYEQDGNFDDAARLFRSSEKVFERFGDTVNLALVYDNLGVIHANYGQKKNAMSYFHKALKLWQQMKSAYGECRTLLYMVDWEMRLGAADTARQWLSKAGRILNQFSDQERFKILVDRYGRLSDSLSS